MSFKSKKRSNEYQSDGGFVVDEDGDNGHGAKKVKTKGSSSAFSSKSSSKKDSNGDIYWNISGLRRVTISEFRGKSMVNIREYYEKDGQELPGKKVRTSSFHYILTLSHFTRAQSFLTQSASIA